VRGGTLTERLTFSASVEVRAAATRVFELVSDLRCKARLNPNIRVIRVELEGGGAVREGAVFSHRFQKGGRIVEYRSRCVRYAPPRLFESRGETEPPFEVRVTVEPTSSGCRLTQEETLEVTPEVMEAVEPSPGARSFRDAVGLLALLPNLRALGLEVQRLQRERVLRRLTEELRVWLEAIKVHMERG